MGSSAQAVISFPPLAAQVLLTAAVAVDHTYRQEHNSSHAVSAQLPPPLGQLPPASLQLRAHAILWHLNAVLSVQGGAAANAGGEEVLQRMQMLTWCRVLQQPTEPGEEGGHLDAM